MLLKIDPKIFFTFRQFHCKFSTVTSINQFSQLPPTIGHNDSQLQEVGANHHEYSCEEPNFHKPKMFLRNT
jgi:hypothetical protein